MLYSPTVSNVTPDCIGDIHPAAIEGMKLFNTGEYWLAHEHLEDAWNDEPGSIRNLYRGILQTAVVYLHVTRANYRGAIKVNQRVQKWITPWPDVCRGIEVGQLRSDLAAVMVEVKRLGPDRLTQFERLLFKEVQWT